jgi:hypothetical protein
VVFVMAAIASTFVGVEKDTVDRTTYTFASVALGAASGHRLIGIIVRSSGTLKTISSVTVDGETADLLYTDDNGNLGRCAVYIAAATGNTTGDIVVVNSGACTCCEVGIWNVANWIDNGVAYDTAVDTTMSSGLLSTTIDVPAGGAIYGLAFNQQGTAFAWSGATEQWDSLFEGAAIRSTGAHLDYAAAVTGQTVSLEGTASTVLRLLASLGVGK